MGVVCFAVGIFSRGGTHFFFFEKFLVYLLTYTLFNVVKLYRISTILSRFVLALCREELPQGFFELCIGNACKRLFNFR